MKPLIIYVDDEPRNLTVFEASIPDAWEVRSFESAVEALKAVKSLKPWVIVSDQRMPVMTGLEFLEVAAQLVPEASRIVVTGQTEEQTIVQLVRRAKISDYITKPWDTDDLVACLTKAIDYYRLLQERNAAVEEIKRKHAELEEKTRQQAQLVLEKEVALQRAEAYEKEVNEWAPPPIVWALKDGSLSLPARKEVVGIVFDIVKSSRLQGKIIQGRSVRSHIQNIFAEILLRKGGLCESQPGDCAYGHFGSVPCFSDPIMAAYTVATEFRGALRGFAKVNNIDVECGIALHYVPDALMQLNRVSADTPRGPVVQKSVVTESACVDVLHRMEKLVHGLRGSNIVMSGDFLARLPNVDREFVALGKVILKGQTEATELFMAPSDLLTDEELDEFVRSFGVFAKEAA